MDSETGNHLQENQREDRIICPICGPWAGPLEVCPYCQASLHKRLSVRVFKYGSLVMAFVGVFVPWYISRHREIPRHLFFYTGGLFLLYFLFFLACYSAKKKEVGEKKTLSL